ncbi:MAG: hypothetical protein KAF91_09460 [Nostoc sp. TH1S01]|nr:hypothetical protein [Nostoc sp. TH1S01]
MSTEELGFKEAFDQIFEKIREDTINNLRAAEAGTIREASAVEEQIELVSGGFDVYEQFDENGNYHFERSQYAPGLTVNLTVTIFSPDDTYSAKLWSSGGGGGEWNNVHINQTQSGSIKTNFWSSTTIKLDVHASTARNAKFRARVDYRV